MMEGLSAGAVPLNYSTPTLSGNDTCMTVSLNPQELGEPYSKTSQQTTQNFSVTVIGQGWKEGKTAPTIAEQDALQRCIASGRCMAYSATYPIFKHEYEYC